LKKLDLNFFGFGNQKGFRIVLNDIFWCGLEEGLTTLTYLIVIMA